MGKVQRVVIVDGEYHEVAHAMREDLSMPSREFFQSLLRQDWPIEDVELPDEKQPKFYRRMLGCLKDIAEGYDIAVANHNRLNDGMWELKADALRLCFYDTDGAGNYEPKLGTRVEVLNEKKWQLNVSELDEFVRVGHAFSKSSQRTLSVDLEHACDIRTEDLDHDKK